MSVEVERLTASDYDEFIPFLNNVFTLAHGRKEDFEKFFPKMCIRDDEHMGKHLAIKKNGKIVSALGVYSLPAKVCGEDIMFSTVGNIATHPDEEGNGYMSILINEAMRELERIGADASRLSGARQRYNRFGYETAGWTYNFVLCPYNIKYQKPKFESDITFVPVSASDTDYLSQMMEIYNKNHFIAYRSDHSDFYLTLLAWESRPYVAVRPNGEVVGYISCTEDKKGITESYAISPCVYKEMLMKWVTTNDTPATFTLFPHMTDEMKLMYEICNDCTISSPSRFKIINWSKVVGAFLKLKSTYSILPDIDFVVGIENYGNIHIQCKNNVTSCTDVTNKASITLSPLDATRFFFDPMSLEFTEKERQALCPLPISWFSLDRV